MLSGRNVTSSGAAAKGGTCARRGREQVDQFIGKHSEIRGFGKRGDINISKQQYGGIAKNLLDANR